MSIQVEVNISLTENLRGDKQLQNLRRLSEGIQEDIEFNIATLLAEIETDILVHFIFADGTDALV